MNSEQITIGLKKARAKYTRAEMAKQLGVTPGSLSRSIHAGRYGVTVAARAEEWLKKVGYWPAPESLLELPKGDLLETLADLSLETFTEEFDGLVRVLHNPSFSRQFKVKRMMELCLEVCRAQQDTHVVTK